MSASRQGVVLEDKRDHTPKRAVLSALCGSLGGRCRLFIGCEAEGMRVFRHLRAPTSPLFTDRFRLV